VSFGSDPNIVVKNAVAGTVNVLKVAHKEPTVKSVVITSSSTAAIVPEPNKPGVVVDGGRWTERP
jgi:nucleoside-diphosphate-sugar epimerase